MDRDPFNLLLRRMILDGSSRRNVLRTGLTALAGSALALVGLSAADDAAAKKRHHKHKHKHHPPIITPPPPPDLVCGLFPCPDQTPCLSGDRCLSRFCEFKPSLGLLVCCEPAGGSCTVDNDCCGVLSCDAATGTCA